MSGITTLGDTDDIAADIPAAVGNVVVVQLRGNGDVANEHETAESEELVGTHGCRLDWIESFVEALDC